MECLEKGVCKRFQDKKIQDIWEFKDIQTPIYPAQKIMQC